MTDLPAKKPSLRTQTQSEKSAAEKQYEKFFDSRPAPAWQQDGDNFSLDQPWPVRFLQTETTYGIGTP